MVTEAAGQNSQTGEARTTGHVSGLAFVKVLVMEHLLKVCAYQIVQLDSGIHWMTCISNIKLHIHFF